MKVYLAAPYVARDQIRDYAAELTRIGYEVVARWLQEQHEITDGTTGPATALDDDQVAGHAHDDLHDVTRANLFVLFTAEAVGGETGSGGRHVETGYAIAKNIPVIVVGKPENIFHRLGRACTVVPDWHQAVLELSARLVDDRRPKAVAVSG